MNLRQEKIYEISRCYSLFKKNKLDEKWLDKLLVPKHFNFYYTKEFTIKFNTKFNIKST